ncbi:hypothetical protein [Rhodospirillum sp. A1_3_36]|uniref:hypothetical protein n=1 Tax=Rhodospirillum sp. A1_3_36 TaxID=3391666 RepID=UPI0039A520AE
MSAKLGTRDPLDEAVEGFNVLWADLNGLASALALIGDIDTRLSSDAVEKHIQGTLRGLSDLAGQYKAKAGGYADRMEEYRGTLVPKPCPPHEGSRWESSPTTITSPSRGFAGQGIPFGPGEIPRSDIFRVVTLW